MKKIFSTLSLGFCLGAFGQNTVYISGNVSGNWTHNNVYIVQHSITVPAGSTLNIEAGTVVKFEAGDTLMVLGSLNAIGNDSAKIVFTSHASTPQPGDWCGIGANWWNIWQPAHATVVLKHCIIEYCKSGVDVYNNFTLDAEYNEFRFLSGVGLYFNYGDATIVGNSIHDFCTSPNINQNANMGIWADVGAPGGIVKCNTIYNTSVFPYTTGIYFYAPVNAENNQIFNMSGGMYVSVYARGNIHNNYIHDCDWGMWLSTLDTITPKVYNNTIMNCRDYGIAVSRCSGGGSYPSYGVSAKIANNILVNDNVGIKQNNGQPYVPVIENNLLWNNMGGDFSNIPLSGLGLFTSTNSNGDASDVYDNLHLDPRFAGNAPALDSLSPCVHAGNSLYAEDIGFDINFSCAAPAPAAPLSLVVPNIFTPNQDGINDDWHCLVNDPKEIKDFKVHVYDRWGAREFESNDVQKSWDGKAIDGVGCPEGTYYYVISYTDVSRTKALPVALKGFIELER